MFRLNVAPRGLIVALLACVAPRVDAQEKPREPEAARAQPAAVEEIVVTATKREENLQDIPLSITALGSDDLDFRDMDDLEDIQQSVPGLLVGTVQGTPVIKIRGIGLNLSTGLGTPGIAAHLDGVYLPRTGSTTIAMVDLERVEVLRGPQGTLYGRNATGGAINFVSKRPGAELGAGLGGGVGTYGRRHAEAWAEGPILTDRLLARAYFEKDRFDGYGTNEANGRDVGDNDVTAGRFALDYRPFQSLDLNASYTRREDDGAYPYTTSLSTIRSLANIEYPREEQSFEPLNTKTARQPQTDRSTQVASLIADWMLPWTAVSAVKSTTGFVRHTRDETNSATDIDRFVADVFRFEESNAYSQEVGIEGSLFDSTVRWLVGGYWGYDETDTPFGALLNLDDVTGLFSLPTGLVFVYDPQPETRDTAWAGFLDGSWSPWERLRLNFGMRYSAEIHETTQSLHAYVRDSRTGNPLVTDATRAIVAASGVTETCDRTDFEDSHDSFDPKVGVEWDAFQDVMAYAQFQTGFKSGGFNVANSCGGVVKPEQIEAIEGGVKSRWLDGRVTANAAAFHYDYRDYQIDRVVGLAVEIVNAPKASTIGAEIETTYVPLDWLSFDLNGTFLDAQFDEFSLADPFANSSTFAGDAPVEDLSGHYLPRAPKFTFSGGVTLATAVEEFATLDLIRATSGRLRMQGFWSDHLFFREFNVPGDRQDAYGTLDVLGEVRWFGDRLGLGLAAKNLTDTRYLVGQLALGTFYYRGGYFAPPRTFDVSIDWVW